MSRMVILGLALVLSSCASLAPSFKVSGNRGDLEGLVGRWYGTYTGGPTHGRSGTISFELVAGEDHAHGTVQLIPEGARAYERFERGLPEEGGGPAARQAPPSRPILTIRIAWVSDRMVQGVLDPYWDPDRATAAATTFRGVADGGRIEGTFTTVYENRAPSTDGTWSVKRR